MPELITRNVTVIDFSNPRKIRLPEVYQPQSCIIKLDRGTTDVGSHCYAMRFVDKYGRGLVSPKNDQGIHWFKGALH